MTSTAQSSMDQIMPPPSIEQSCFRTLGERLLYLRQRRSMTLADAVAATGISRAELSRLENGTRRIHPEHALLLASAYGVDLSIFREILQFQPNMRLSKVQPEEKPSGHVRIAVHDEDELAAGHRRPSREHMELALSMTLSASAYGVRVGRMAGEILIRQGSLVIVDPGARTIIGDLVVNAVSHTPVFVTLERGEDGMLTGNSGAGATVFPAETRVRQFHKVVVVLPASHVFST